MRAGRFHVLSLVIVLILSTGDSLAQTATGAVNGTVTDQSGAVVSGARVTLSNQKTNIGRQTATSLSGFFLFINVPPGEYALRVTREGFKQIDVPNLLVNVNQTLTQNLRLTARRPNSER